MITVETFTCKHSEIGELIKRFVKDYEILHISHCKYSPSNYNEIGTEFSVILILKKIKKEEIEINVCNKKMLDIIKDDDKKMLELQNIISGQQERIRYYELESKTLCGYTKNLLDKIEDIDGRLTNCHKMTYELEEKNIDNIEKINNVLKQLDRLIEDSNKNAKYFYDNNLTSSQIGSEAMAVAYNECKKLLIN